MVAAGGCVENISAGLGGVVGKYAPCAACATGWKLTSGKALRASTSLKAMALYGWIGAFWAPVLSGVRGPVDGKEPGEAGKNGIVEGEAGRKYRSRGMRMRYHRPSRSSMNHSLPSGRLHGITAMSLRPSALKS